MPVCTDEHYIIDEVRSSAKPSSSRHQIFQRRCTSTAELTCCASVPKEWQQNVLLVLILRRCRLRRVNGQQRYQRDSLFRYTLHRRDEGTPGRSPTNTPRSEAVAWRHAHPVSSLAIVKDRLLKAVASWPNFGSPRAFFGARGRD